MMKKIVSLVLSIILCTGICANASDIVNVTLNNEPMKFDVPAQIIDDRTFVPMRAIFESLGAEIEWIPDYRMIIAYKGSKIISMMVDKNVLITQDVLTNEASRIELDVAPKIIDNRTLVPIRAVAESLNADVNWDADTKTVKITK